MSATEHCASCRFWAVHPGGSGLGDCRRRAPIRLRENDRPKWPGTSAQHWCGEYAPKAAGVPMEANRPARMPSGG